MDSVLQMWESFRRDVVPPEASPVQVEECRRAFYAGVWSTYCELLKASGDDVTEEQSEAWLQSVDLECRAMMELLGLPGADGGRVV